MNHGPERRARRDVYLYVTEFVVSDVRPRYEVAEVPCTNATIAAVAAPLFITLCRDEGAG